jgi:type IV secretion system protein VirD4
MLWSMRLAIRLNSSLTGHEAHDLLGADHLLPSMQGRLTSPGFSPSLLFKESGAIFDRNIRLGDSDTLAAALRRIASRSQRWAGWLSTASAIVYDEKGELWALTAGWRASGADNVVIRWEPGVAEGSAGFNFLEEVRLGTPNEVADAQNIAQMLCDPEGRGLADHWQKTSFALLTGLILHVLYNKKKERGATASLADVAYALSDPSRKSEELWGEMVANRHLNGKLHRERGSVLSSAKTYLVLFQDPLIAENTRHSYFRILDLMNHGRPVSLFVVTRGDDKERLRPLVRLMLAMITRRLMGVDMPFKNGQPVMPHRHRLLLMLDEFPSLNRLHLIEDALPKCASYGIKTYLATQDREQMFRSYGEHQSITGNCHIRIIYAPNEWKTGEWVSQMVGNTTIVKEDVTESGTRYGPMKHISRTYHEVSRPLLTPNEIMQLRKPEKNDKREIIAPGEMVIFVAGEAPIRGTQILYFQDPVFSRRARISAPAKARPPDQPWHSSHDGAPDSHAVCCRRNHADGAGNRG